MVIRGSQDRVTAYFSGTTAEIEMLPLVSQFQGIREGCRRSSRRSWSSGYSLLSPWRRTFWDDAFEELFKDGKEHRYWSVVENRRRRDGRVVRRQALYLGEINDSQRAAWCRSNRSVAGRFGSDADGAVPG